MLFTGSTDLKSISFFIFTLLNFELVRSIKIQITIYEYPRATVRTDFHLTRIVIPADCVQTSNMKKKHERKEGRVQPLN